MTDDILHGDEFPNQPTSIVGITIPETNIT